MMRRRPFDTRRLIAGVVTVVLMVAVAWLAIYAATESREPPRVFGRFRAPKLKVRQLQPVVVQRDPTTGEVVVIASDGKGHYTQIRVPAVDSSQGSAEPGSSGLGGLPPAGRRQLPALPALPGGLQSYTGPEGGSAPSAPGPRAPAAER